MGVVGTIRASKPCRRCRTRVSKYFPVLPGGKVIDGGELPALDHASGNHRIQFVEVPFQVIVVDHTGFRRGDEWGMGILDDLGRLGQVQGFHHCPGRTKNGPRFPDRRFHFRVGLVKENGFDQSQAKTGQARL